MQELFGGSKQKSQATSTPVDATPTPFANLRDPFADVLAGVLKGGGAATVAGVPQYSGPTTAPVSGQESDLLNLLGTLKGGQGSNLIAETVAGKFADPNANPFLKSYIEAAQRPTLQGLEETLTRALPGRFTAAGQFVQPQGSSAFDRAAAIATRGAADAVSDIATRIGAGAYEAERGRQQEAIKLGQSEVDTTIKNLQASALPRLIQQYGLDVGLQQFRDRLNALLSILGVTAQVTRPNIAQQTQQTSEGTSSTGVISTLFSPFKIAANLGNI